VNLINNSGQTLEASGDRLAFDRCRLMVRFQSTYVAYEFVVDLQATEPVEVSGGAVRVFASGIADSEARRPMGARQSR
jgi:hypothetical protein